MHDLAEDVSLRAPVALPGERARQDPSAMRLQQVRGIGPLTATALLATVGDTSQFSNGREMAASFGLTPKRNSSGGTERLLGISKRGDDAAGAHPSQEADCSRHR